MRARTAVPLVLAAVVALPSAARAYDHQATVELGVGFAHAFGTPSMDENALAAELGGSVGLGDTFSLRGSFTYAGYPPGWSHVGILGVEVVYLFDLLEVVPYFGAGADAVGTVGPVGRADFAVHGVAGLDWLFARGMYLGLELRPVVVLTALDTVPVQLTATLRFGLIVDV